MSAVAYVFKPTIRSFQQSVPAGTPVQVGTIVRKASPFTNIVAVIVTGRVGDDVHVFAFKVAEIAEFSEANDVMNTALIAQTFVQGILTNAYPVSSGFYYLPETMVLELGQPVEVVLPETAPAE